MNKWTRALYQPVLPLGENGARITGCASHIALSREAAGEGMVLLKNKDLLPLKRGAKLALFGKGCIDYVKGGGGSGDVTVAYTRNLYQGLCEKEKEGKVSLFHQLPAFYQDEMKLQYGQGAVCGLTKEPVVPEKLLKEAAAFTDTALISICRFSGEGWDRKASEKSLEGQDAIESQRANEIFERSDYYLSRAEEAMVEQVKSAFTNIIVVLNVGGMVDSSWFFSDQALPSVLLSWQGGMEGGLATADVLCGDVNPSGKLPDTFASCLEAYPSTEGFHHSREYVEYTEDIYVGYRYFETLPGADKKVNYPFGFGLSYTDFGIFYVEGNASDETISVRMRVTNKGSLPGKEVVQLYYSAPCGILQKPARELAAFAKTSLLMPEESEEVTLCFATADMASYDDLGKAAKSAYILEKGKYRFYAGNSIRSAAELPFSYEIGETRIARQLSPKLVPPALPRRLLADGSLESLPAFERQETASPLPPLDIDILEGLLPEVRPVPAKRICEAEEEKKGRIFLQDVFENKATLSDFLSQLDESQLIDLLGGQPNTGVANTFGLGNLSEYGVPNITTADGPAGMRIQPQCGIHATAWPCATLLAASFNPEIISRIGKACARELKENNLGIWLAPAVNIHRSPLCGRNFEYYSEDPLLAGKCGAALIRGVQSEHIGATAKHFACNNKETNRKDSDSRVSERALREIYLRPFEIIVKESAPYAIMSSYNLINGVQASESQELLTDILRDEWGFDGMVTTDWWTHGEHFREINAGNDLKMGSGYPERVKSALAAGAISRKELEISAERILRVILKVD